VPTTNDEASPRCKDPIHHGKKTPGSMLKDDPRTKERLVDETC
jgi:hypothetical protein